MVHNSAPFEEQGWSVGVAHRTLVYVKRMAGWPTNKDTKDLQVETCASQRPSCLLRNAGISSNHGWRRKEVSIRPDPTFNLEKHRYFNSD